MLIPSGILWAAAQLRGVGHVLTTVSDLPLNSAITLAAAFCIGYTVLGGLLADAITDLIKNKPYLARATQRFQGTGDGGSRNGGRPKQITSREELAKMTPAQRLQAHQEGRLKNLLQN